MRSYAVWKHSDGFRFDAQSAMGGYQVKARGFSGGMSGWSSFWEGKRRDEIVERYDDKGRALRPEGTTIVAYFTRGYDSKDRP